MWQSFSVTITSNLMYYCAIKYNKYTHTKIIINHTAYCVYYMYSGCFRALSLTRFVVFTLYLETFFPPYNLAPTNGTNDTTFTQCRTRRRHHNQSVIVVRFLLSS